MANINIAHIAYGSFQSPIAATTLGYSPNVSHRGRSVDGVFADINGSLSAAYSSLLWRYYHDTDSYMLTHVQGHSVGNLAMARSYSYRDASEVTRNDLLAFGFPLANVMQTMPRIESFDGAKSFPLQYTMKQHIPIVGQGADQLKQIIFYALANGLQLYVGMMTGGRPLRDNGIFDTVEWNTLIEAIDKLDVALRQYVSFAFCVDNNYSEHLSDKVVVFYARESGIHIPLECINIQFEQIPEYSYRDSVQKSVKNDGLLFKDISDKEEDKPFSYHDFKTKIHELRSLKDRINLGTKKSADFSKEEYQMWRDLGHRIEELNASDWGELKSLLELVGGTQSKDGIALLSYYRAVVTNWSIDGLDLQELQELNNLGIIDKDRMNQQLDHLFTKALFNCTDANSAVECIKTYSNSIIESAMVEQLAQFTTKKNDDLIEDLLKICTTDKINEKEKRIVRHALKLMAGKKAQKNGTSVERWYKFLSELSKQKERPLSEKLYLSCVKDFDETQFQQLGIALDEYAELHDINAKKYAFRLIEAFVNAKKGKPVKWPKRPADKDANEKGNDAKNDAQNAGEKSFAFLKKEWKGRIIRWLIPIVLLVLLIAVLLSFLFFFKRNRIDTPTTTQIPYQISVSPGIEDDHFLYKLTCFRPEVKNAFVMIGTQGEQLNLSDINALCRYDSIYTQSEMKQDSTQFIKADFVTFQWPKSDPADSGKDTIKTSGKSPFLLQVYRRQQRVHEVLVYYSVNNDTLHLDIPNTKVFDALDVGNSSKGLSSPDYFLWLVRTIEQDLASRNLEQLKLAY